MNPTAEHAEHTDPATPLKEPGGHPVLTALAVLAVGAATAFFLHLRAPLRRLVSELVLNWGTGPRTPGDWALLVPTWAVVCIAAGIVGILLVAFLMRKGALALSLAALVAAPFFLAFAILSLHAATFLPLSDAFQSMAKAASAPAPVFACRANIGESGSFPVVRDWRLRYGPDEATADGIPKWSVELVKGDDPRNRLLPNRWHGLQPCEVAPALVATNETRVLPVRGGPWLLRLTLEDVGVGEDGAVRGRALMELLPRFAAPVVAPSGSALALLPGRDGGPPELLLLRDGTETPLGTAEDFAGEWDEDAWIDAVAFTNVLGADGFAVTTSVGLHCGTEYLAEKEGGLVPLATSWRRENAFLDPISCGWMDFAVDLDGDGVRELVCDVEQWAHDCAWPRTFWPHVHIFRLADGHVEECGDTMPLLGEPDRSAAKRYAESQWSPSDGKISILFVTEDGERRVFSVAPDLSRLAFKRTEAP